MRSTVAVIGGYFGAGKTTLMWKIAQRLIQDGKKVGMVANDEPVKLADTQFMEFMNDQTEKGAIQQTFHDYRGFSDAIAKVKKDGHAEVILAKPADGCMTTSGTLLKRLKDEFPDDLAVAPYTVAIDPERLQDLLVGRDTLFHNSTLYMMGIQLEEADVIAVNKSDRLPKQGIDLLIKKAKTKWPNAEIVAMSAKTGEGIDEWIKLVTNGQSASFREVKADERKLSEGTSALSYINTTFELQGSSDWCEFTEDLIDSLNERFKNLNAAVGHVKVSLKSENNQMVQRSLIGYEKYLTGLDLPWNKEGAQMIVSARVQLPQEELRNVVAEEVKAAYEKRNLRM